MVRVSPESVEEFKRIVKEEYGVEYSDQEAWEASHNLVGFFDLLIKMDQKQNPENYTKKENSETEGGVKEYE